MSAFLGPIHHWLFRKIRFQDALADYIAGYAEKKGWGEHLLSRMEQKCGVLEKGELEELIDGSNIHGWLQARIEIVERRLACLVTEILSSSPDKMGEIKKAAYEFGTQHPAEEEISVKEANEYLEAILLNGMPCDHVNMITEETEEQISWQQRIDIHAPFWQQYQGDVTHYYEIRNEVIRGIFVNSGITYHQTGEQAFRLSKEV